ncbi:MAG: ribonuclease III domain-containing protein [Bacillota bacterium]|nr:ribonuclease III domain-containing protein [Bacillota bacterium]
MLINHVLDEQELKEYSPIVLAYIGDAAFELIVRTHLIQAGNRRIKEIHKDAVGIVKAESQAKIVRQIYDTLSEQEKDIVRRGRNAKSHPPRNADVQQYKMSTGFEALLGYLYLKGDEQRLLTLASLALEQPEK